MKTIIAKFTITTPMFLTGASQKGAGEMRPPSIKGALRFWWRALYWQKILSESQNDEVEALKKLHQREKELFGASAEFVDGKEKGGQGCFLLSAEWDAVKSTSNEPNGIGYKYLKGQGLDGRERASVERFGLKVLFKPEVSESLRKANQKEISDALLTFGLLGGLGSRARKGFGSVAIQSWDSEDLDIDLCEIPQNQKEYEAALRLLIGNPTNTLPPFTAFSRGTRIEISQIGNNAHQLLDNIGKEMHTYRSAQSDEKNFADDTQLMKTFSEKRKIGSLPKRVAFGLPHNYSFKDTRRDVSIDAAGENRKRRGSPLFIHIHQFPKGQFGAVSAFIPACFLPEKDEVELSVSEKIRGHRQVTFSQKIPHSDADWSVITDYLDRFTSKSDYKKVIP